MAGIDPSIILQAGQGGGPGGGLNIPGLAALNSQIQSAKQQRAIQDFELMRAQRADADEQQLRELVSQGGAPEEIQQRLMGAGRLKEATTYQEQITKQRQQQLAQQEQVGKLLKQATSFVLANPSEQNAIAAIARLEKMTSERMDDDRAAVYALKGDPKAIARWAAGHALEADKLLPKVDEADMGGTRDRTVTDPVSGELISSTSTPKTMTPGEVASNRIAQGNLAVNQGQLSVAQEKLGLEREKNTRDSVAQQKLDLKEAADEKAVQYRAGLETQKNDIMLRTIDEVIDGTTKMSSGIPGKVGALIPGTSTYDLDKKIDTLKANIGFGALAQMREASKSGGALGQVAVKELEFLQATLGSLDIGQSMGQKIATLKEIRSLVKNWNEQVKIHAGVGGKVNDLPDPSTHKGYEAVSSDGKTTYVSDGSRWVRKK